MKYVMFVKEDAALNTSYPVIFPNHLVHADIAEALLAGPLKGFKVRSAGELSSVGMGETVGGKSITLDVSSHEDDKLIINMQDYGGCFL